ncbi:hypothetical protein [Brevibacterium jeotgali]|uniref:Ribosomal protein L7/L12 C-terminal domain-containing protein n=1 Tax=Brevibacterium jeotgali TaxID=1262550 RepID=A0A2H1L6W9_9MICO|nr:hypothetical protein [Brevibacterium jeotgali]TWC02302.1 hypothetical protein FB108_0974 [Brevibacterium jeotgali]SMY12646.1 hypothetical protein BJEO58_02246 [Brevibacterium jeotgali]
MFGDNLAHARIDALTRRVTALEALVERLVDDAGISQDEVAELRQASNPGLTPEVRRLVAEDRTIEAIKQYRRATGAGLIDAKRAVEEYAARGHSS